MKRKYIIVLVCACIFIFMDILVFHINMDTLKLTSSNKRDAAILPKAVSIDENSLHMLLEKDDKVNELILKLQGAEKMGNVKFYINRHVTVDGRKVLNGNPYLVFECKKCSLGFRNSININSKLVNVFNIKTSRYKTLKIPIDYKLFNYNLENIISINSGVREDESYNNKNKKMDNFYVRNVRLILNDGTLIRDGKYQDSTIAVGSGKKRKKKIYFNFNIPKEKFTSTIAVIKYDSLRQGKNNIKVLTSDTVLKEKFLFDSEPPTIKPNFKNNVIYKDRVKINFTVKDKVSKVKLVSVKLDNREISIPYEDLASRLKPGKHIVKVIAADSQGNQVTEYFCFTTSRENYDVNIKTNNNIKDVIVGKSPLEKYNVYVYEGEKCSGRSIDVYGAANRLEPMVLANKNERQFLSENQKLIEKVDGKLLKMKSKYNLPYEKFDIKIKAGNLSSKIKIVWKGYVESSQRLTMYAWNVCKNKWVPLKSTLADGKNAEITASVTANNYADQNCIHVIVQSGNTAVLEEKCNDFTFAWMSDTQYYSKKYSDIYKSITDWLAENRKEIKYVIHSGDLVDNYNDINQWTIADNCMKVLERYNIPYGVLPGNHDVNHEKGNLKYYCNYFGAKRFKESPVFGGTYRDNKGHYDLISAGGNDFIVMYMGWEVQEDEIRWMNKVLSKNREKKAILVFHEYMFEYGSRTPTGNTIFKNVVIPNPNVLAVLCGHFHESRMLVDEIDDDEDGETDRRVYQILADYQDGPRGGEGFIRLLKFNCKSNTIDVCTYSPYLRKVNFYDKKKYPLKDTFTIDMDLKPLEKAVATDYFGAAVYTNKKLCEYRNVTGGNIIHIDGSKISEKYDGYFIVTEDSSGKKSVTDVYNN